ncbi:membrane fusion protein, multidrug efflux system [Acinetobacter puyangensis]|uniref:Membrane fusion protein, multidrug efflux system n=2 Tax=Acinetobacter puyangensis TaxID=1096779 RepID=A0A240ECY1_9GAMM|nr:membrane fusion protein, multidrug efflux system [Acinetobacter puyangensis]
MNMAMNMSDFAKILILGLVALCLQACSKPQAEVEQEKIVMVTQPVNQQSQLHSYAGDVVARQQTALAFRVGGQLIERYADVGDRVKVGQVLAKLDVKDADLQLNAARAQLEQAQAAEKNAQVEYQRFQQLLPDHAVSRSQFDAIENQYKAALSSLKQAQANYAVAQNQTRYNQLLANKNGVITERNIEVGQVVAAGQAAYQIAIDGEREVAIGVPEQVINQMKVGQSAWISLWSTPDQRHGGFIREIAPAADQTRTFAVKVAFKNSNVPIQLGQSARVFFNLEQASQLNVPLASISAVNQNPYVWILKPDNTLNKVLVTMGEYQHDVVPILSGLKADQWVVVGGVHLLREGQKVKPVDRENRPVRIKANTYIASQQP